VRFGDRLAKEQLSVRARNSEQEDYLLRVIRQAGDVLRLLRERLLRGAHAPEVVRQQAGHAIEGVLGAQAGLLARVDPATAVKLVGDAQRVALWSALLDVEADAIAAGGDTEQAARRHARAAALRAAGTAEWGS
jgi:hypothetical protein